MTRAAGARPEDFFVQRGDRGQPRLVVLDLGSATEIRPHLADGLGDIIRGFVARDDVVLMRGIETMGFVAEGGDRALLERTVRHYFRQILHLDVVDSTNLMASLRRPLSRRDDAGRLRSDSNATLSGVSEPTLDRGELRALMRSIAYPLGWFHVERAALILYAVASQLAPTLNVVQVAFPYIARFLAERDAGRRLAPAVVGARVVATLDPRGGVAA